MDTDQTVDSTPDGLPDDGQPSNGQALAFEPAATSDPATSREALDQLTPDEAAAYTNRYHPDHQAAVDKVHSALAGGEAGDAGEATEAVTATEADGDVDEDRLGTEAQLENEFGPDYMDHVADGITALHQLGGGSEHIVRRLDEAGLGNDPAVLSDAINLSQEDRETPGTIAAIREVIGEGMLPDTAQLEIDRLLADPEFAKKWQRGDKFAKARMTALHTAAHPPAWIGAANAKLTRKW